MHVTNYPPTLRITNAYDNNKPLTSVVVAESIGIIERYGRTVQVEYPVVVAENPSTALRRFLELNANVYPSDYQYIMVGERLVGDLSFLAQRSNILLHERNRFAGMTLVYRLYPGVLEDMKQFIARAGERDGHADA